MTTQNGVIITRAEMRRRDSLIQWRPILAFRIGEWSNSISRSLPDPQSFPRKFAVIPERLDGYPFDWNQEECAFLLGRVLGIAEVVAMRRSEVTAYGNPRDVLGHGYFAHLGIVHKAISRLPYGAVLVESYLHVLASVLNSAASRPDRLRLFYTRLDALDNKALHRMAMNAVQGIADDDILADLLEPAEGER